MAPRYSLMQLVAIPLSSYESTIAERYIPTFLLQELPTDLVQSISSIPQDLPM